MTITFFRTAEGIFRDVHDFVEQVHLKAIYDTLDSVAKLFILLL